MSPKAKHRKLQKKLPEETETSVSDEQLFLEYLAQDIDIPNKEEADLPLSREKPKRRKAKRKQKPAEEFDLHGLTLSQAVDMFEENWERLKERSMHGFHRVRFITGKGLHSGLEGPVLGSEFYDYVVERCSQYIESIDESPAAVVLYGVAIRGYFDVTFRS